MTNTSDEPVTDHQADRHDPVRETPPGRPSTTCSARRTPISDVDCSADLDDPIAPHQTVSCTFTVTLSGNAQIVRDRVDVVVTDNDGQIAADVAAGTGADPGCASRVAIVEDRRTRQ